MRIFFAVITRYHRRKGDKKTHLLHKDYNLTEKTDIVTHLITVGYGPEDKQPQVGTEEGFRKARVGLGQGRRAKARGLKDSQRLHLAHTRQFKDK